MLDRNRIDAGSPRRLATFVGALLMLALLSGCSLHGDNGKVAHDQEAPVGVTPNAVNKLPENISAVTVTIANGKFSVDQVTLQEQGGSIIHVVNQDGTAYQFQVVPNLVTAAAIAPKATTDVSFTSSTAGNFTGQLLPQGGGSVLASVNLRIQSPGGVNPP